MSDESGAGGPSGLTLGEVVRAALPSFTQTHRLPAPHWKVLRAITACRTPALGGHQYQCAHCGQAHFVPHSCRNRHCPTCQGLQGAEWLERQAQDLLPIPYFHVVFTLPHALNPLIQHHQQRLYNLLFASATATLLEFGQNNLKAQLGITAILHTWSQTLGDHLLAYLCRYTHRVGISNRRLESLDRQAQTVTFSYTDSAHKGQKRSMTLSLEAFLRHFCLHLLPPRFVKIRHYGRLANRGRSLHIAQARQRIGSIPTGPETSGDARRPLKHLEPRPLLCPHCGQPTLILIRIIRPPRNPPPALADTS